MEFPAVGRELLQAGDAFPICQGKDINHNFVDKVVDGQPMQQTEAFLAVYLCRVDERGIFFVLLTNQIQHGIARE
ncbi:hypothetical protein SAMN05444349_11157 [Bacteroides faecichinchillae]|uniref:Uncharacterized protein n=1 Tax=Bacteroides faecichinchillae TaxID=871325 RepID=A0A1M4YVI0_9BACE|nr:hypothetical protein SAMN05444349_11157 [Bacteroides faecichinchillae]